MRRNSGGPSRARLANTTDSRPLFASALTAAGAVPASKCPEEWRPGADHKAEVIPVAASADVVEGKSVPPAEYMGNQDDPGSQAVPEAPEYVLPPHRALSSSVTVRLG